MGYVFGPGAIGLSLEGRMPLRSKILPMLGRLLPILIH